MGAPKSMELPKMEQGADELKDDSKEYSFINIHMDTMGKSTVIIVTMLLVCIIIFFILRCVTCKNGSCCISILKEFCQDCLHKYQEKDVWQLVTISLDNRRDDIKDRKEKQRNRETEQQVTLITKTKLWKESP